MKRLFTRLMRQDIQKLVLKTAESHSIYWLSVRGLILAALSIKLADGKHSAGIGMVALWGNDHSYNCAAEIPNLKSVVYNNDQARGMGG